MSILRFFGAGLLLSVLPALATGQSPPENAGLVSGIVQSEDGVPVPSAWVSLRRSVDSLTVAGGVTAADGAFRIEAVAPGGYLLEVSHLGFETAIRNDVTVTHSVRRVDLGVIRLEPRAIALEEIAVRAQRPPMVVLHDRNVYSTADMPAAVGGTATDVLRSVPELEVGVEGRVTARGATPAIHLNGRPAPMQGEALDRYLRQLPAERIDRIEVISHPSARYEARGQGGIVNIVMKRGTRLGLSGSVALNAGTRNGRGGSGSLNYQAGRLTLFGSASGSFSENDRESSDLRQNLSARPATYVQQASHDRSSGSFSSVDLAAEVKVGSDGTLWSEAGIGRNASQTDDVTAYTHLDHLFDPTQRYDRVNDRDLRALFGSFAFGFDHVAGAGGGEWSVVLRRNIHDDDDASRSTREWLSTDGAALDRPSELTSAVEGHDQGDLSLEASLTRGWGESGQVEAGYRGSWRSTVNDFRLQVEGSGGAGSAAESVGEFRHRERIHAGFLTAHRRLGRFRVQLGVRGEQAEVRTALPRTGDTFETSHLDLFPSVNVSTGVGTGGQLRLSYSRRVDRPGPGILNPAIPTLDPLNRRVGNPYLTPRYTHSLSLTASRTGRLGTMQISPFYRRSVDGWDQVRTVDEAGVSTVTWENLATTTSYGGSINASLTQLGPVGGFVSVRGYREVRDASNLRPEFSGSSTRFSVVGNVHARPTSTLSLQGTLTYLPARELPQGRISSMTFSTVGVRQELWDGRASIHLTVFDPFELQGFTFTTRDGTHVQVGTSEFSARHATLGLSYSFGRPPKRDRRRDAPEEDAPESEVRIR